MTSKHGMHWPRPSDPNPDGPRLEVREQPRWISVLRDVISAVLVITTALTVLYALRVDQRLSDLEAATDARVQQRNQQLAELEQLIHESTRQAMCSVLDGLPAGPLLDGARATYGCGPGVPVSQLTPEQQDQLQQFSDGSFDPLATRKPGVKPLPSDRAGSTAQPAEPSQEPSARPAPATSTPAPSAAPTANGMPLSTTPPLVDVSGLTDLVCAATGVCA